MLKLERTLAFLEDRITYFHNVNNFIGEQREKGIEVQVEGEFAQKIVDWETGRKYIHDLANPLVADKYQKAMFLKTTIKEDMITMIKILSFNLEEHKKEPIVHQEQIRSCESYIDYLKGCINELNNLKA
jgi:hypothetical protein